MHWVAPGRVLIAWDGGRGPHFARSGGAYIKRKAFASFDVYRTTDDGDMVGILIGTTCAEAFLDVDAPDGCMVWYRIMGRTKAGTTKQVGPRVPVIVPSRTIASWDTTPPSPPRHLKAHPRTGGNLLQWAASSDAESGLLAYFVYTSNQPQPDSVVWANDEVQAGSHAVRQFLDRTTEPTKQYQLRAIDSALNLSEPSNLARAVEVAYCALKLRINYVNEWNDGLLVANSQRAVVRVYGGPPELTPVWWERTITLGFNTDIMLSDMEGLKKLVPADYNIRITYPYGADQPSIAPSDFYTYTLGFQYGPDLAGESFTLTAADTAKHPHEITGTRMHDVHWALVASTHDTSSTAGFRPVVVWPAEVPTLPIDAAIRDASHLAELQAIWDAAMADYVATLYEELSWDLPDGTFVDVKAPDSEDHVTPPPTSYALDIVWYEHDYITVKDSWRVVTRRPSYVGQLATDIYGCVPYDEFTCFRAALAAHADALWANAMMPTEFDGLTVALDYSVTVAR